MESPVAIRNSMATDLRRLRAFLGANPHVVVLAGVIMIFLEVAFRNDLTYALAALLDYSFSSEEIADLAITFTNLIGLLAILCAGIVMFFVSLGKAVERTFDTCLIFMMTIWISIGLASLVPIALFGVASFIWFLNRFAGNNALFNVTLFGFVAVLATLACRRRKA